MSNPANSADAAADQKVDLKNPVLAGVLAYLVPGAGHLYQRRVFKGLIYLFCISGTFLFGMYLGEWRSVYWVNRPGKRTFGYLAQVGLGLPTLPALLQNRRANAPDNVDSEKLSSSVSGEFRGLYIEASEDGRENLLGRAEGTLSVEPVHGTFKGTFNGSVTPENGQSRSIDLTLGRHISLEKPINADSRRRIEVFAVDGKGDIVARLSGTVPRPFIDWYAAPPDDRVLQDLNGRLGKQYELALVFTWVAGLLNLLAVWDAVEGPAYGYRLEKKAKPEPKKAEAAGSGDDASGEPAATKPPQVAATIN